MKIKIEKWRNIEASECRLYHGNGGPSLLCWIYFYRGDWLAHASVYSPVYEHGNTSIWLQDAEKSLRTILEWIDFSDCELWRLDMSAEEQECRDGDRYIAQLDRGREWPQAGNE